MISMVVQYIRMALLMISIIKQCNGIEIAYDKHSWDCIEYDNHSCAMHRDCFAFD